METAFTLVYRADMEGKALHICTIRKYCTSDQMVGAVVRLADSLGVKIKGDLRYGEQRAALGLTNNPRA